MRVHAIVLSFLVVITTYLVFMKTKITIMEGSKEALPLVLWRDMSWPILVQGLVIFATVIALISLIRERIMR